MNLKKLLMLIFTIVFTSLFVGTAYAAVTLDVSYLGSPPTDVFINLYEVNGNTETLIETQSADTFGNIFDLERNKEYRIESVENIDPPVTGNQQLYQHQPYMGRSHYIQTGSSFTADYEISFKYAIKNACDGGYNLEVFEDSNMDGINNDSTPPGHITVCTSPDQFCHTTSQYGQMSPTRALGNVNDGYGEFGVYDAWIRLADDKINTSAPRFQMDLTDGCTIFGSEFGIVDMIPLQDIMKIEPNTPTVTRDGPRNKVFLSIPQHESIDISNRVFPCDPDRNSFNDLEILGSIKYLPSQNTYDFTIDTISNTGNGRTILPTPEVGSALITSDMNCRGTTHHFEEQHVYVYPSGHIVDCLGNPVIDAEVKLLQKYPQNPSNNVSPFHYEQFILPNIKDHMPQVNPQITTGTAFYGWDIFQPGTYKVIVTKHGQFIGQSHEFNVPNQPTYFDIIVNDPNGPSCKNERNIIEQSPLDPIIIIPFVVLAVIISIAIYSIQKSFGKTNQ